MEFKLEDIKSIARVINSFGGRAMLVGGAVRDMIIEREVKDFDLEVYKVNPLALPIILKTLAKTYRCSFDSVGASFQVYKLGRNLDVSLPRRDRKTGVGHKGFAIEGDPDMGFEEAARRRDFTMNAMLYCPMIDKIYDPFGGKFDLLNKVLKVVDPETFVEDSLRALRAVQFAARFGLDIDPDSKELIKSMDLSDLPSERIFGEMEKMLLSSKPSVGLHLMQELGINDKLFPEISAMVGVPQEFEWHPEGDVFTHTALALDVAATELEDLDRPRKLTVMLAMLCHDLGKAVTTEHRDGRWRAHGHSEAGVPLTESVLDRLNVHTLDGFDVRNQVLEIVRYHLVPGEFHRQKEKIRAASFRRLARKVELDLLRRVFRGDNDSRNTNDHGMTFSNEAEKWFSEKAREIGVEREAPKQLLMGRDLIALGMKPSKEFTPILEHFFERQLEGEFSTREEGLPLLASYVETLCTK